MPDSIYKQCLDEVRSDIAALSLSGVNSTAIVVRKFPWDDKMIHRGITVSWSEPVFGSRGSNLSSTSCRDMIGYPCHVTLVEGTGRGWTDELNRTADRAQKIRRIFHLKRLTTVSATDVNHIICKVQNGHMTVPEKHLRNNDVTQLTVMCWFLEPRSN